VLSAKDTKFLALLHQNEALGDPGTNIPAVLADAQYVCDEMNIGGNPLGVALAAARRVAEHRRKRRDVVSLHVHGGLLPADRRPGLTRIT